MGYEAQVIENQKAIQKILSDAKEIPDLDDVLSTLNEDDLIPLYSSSEEKSVKTTLLKIIQLVASSLGYYASEKQSILFSANQTVYNIPSKPYSIDLYKKGQWQIEQPGYDYSYNNATGNLTILNESEVEVEYTYRAFGRFSTKQSIITGADNQVVFNYSGAPINIDVYYEGQLLLDSDYTRTSLSEGNSLTITNPDVIKFIKAGKTLEIRKF